MDKTQLPVEIILMILGRTLPHVSQMHGLNYRSISKEFNKEIERKLFVEGRLDRYPRPGKKEECLTCFRGVRYERPEKAINKATVIRYLVALLAHRKLPKWDMRLKLLGVFREVMLELKGELGNMGRVPEDIRPLNEDAQEALDPIMGGVPLDIQPLSKDAQEVLDFLPKPGKGVGISHGLIEARMLADTLVTLYGVRLIWSKLGPHHDNCGDIRDMKEKSKEFWLLCIAVHLGNLKLVQKYLDRFRYPTLETKYDDIRYHQSWTEYKAECVRADNRGPILWTEALGAALNHCPSTRKWLSSAISVGSAPWPVQSDLYYSRVFQWSDSPVNGFR